MSNTAIVHWMAPSFDDPDRYMTEERALVFIRLTLGVAVVSLSFMLWSMEARCRHTFFRPKSGKKVRIQTLTEAPPRPHRTTHST